MASFGTKRLRATFQNGVNDVTWEINADEAVPCTLYHTALPLRLL
jgi:hypothetical protein